MFGSEILEVAIGMGVLYLVLSLICSAITEAIARAFAMRSSTLRSGIHNLLSDPYGKGFTKDFYNHPLIKGLYRQSWFVDASQMRAVARKAADQLGAANDGGMQKHLLIRGPVALATMMGAASNACGPVTMPFRDGTKYVSPIVVGP